MQAARLMRSFRAPSMRMVARAEGMRIVIEALFQAVLPIMNVALVCILFYLIFGILGLNLFGGKMYYAPTYSTERHQLPGDGHSGQGRHQAVVRVGHVSHRVRRRRPRRAVLGCERLGFARVTSTVSELNADLNRCRDHQARGRQWASKDTLAVLTADLYDPTERFGLRASYVDGTIEVGYNTTAVREAVTT